MNNPDNFADLFAPEPEPPAVSDGAAWKVLLVDDEPDIHAVLRLALHGVVVDGRRLELLDAASAEDAKTWLREAPDIAIVLLDVVMETEHAGLDLVRYIREDLGNRNVQIVLITGQPGYAPPRDIVVNYEINGYRLKSELTADKVFFSVHAALRTYQLLQQLEQQRAQTEALVAARTTELAQANARLEQEQAELVKALADIKQVQSQLLQSEKMASIGQLAAGVAHEINNPIGFVGSNFGTLSAYIDDLLQIIDAGGDSESIQAAASDKDLPYLRHDIVDLLRESRDGIDRVRKIVANLKDFSHVDQQEEWNTVDLLAGLESTIQVVWHELKYKVELQRELQPLPPVECIAAQINQVFMNLLVNAAQAIPERGTITLRSGVADVAGATGAMGDGVWVEVADTGSGMPPEVQRRMFEPFFTTKPVGKGTGLGMSISYDIIHRHGGHFEVESTPGAGTRSRVVLPCVRAAEGLVEQEGPVGA